jgi:hypothetical protein
MECVVDATHVDRDAAGGLCAPNDHHLHFGLGLSPKTERAFTQWTGRHSVQIANTPALAIGLQINYF